MGEKRINYCLNFFKGLACFGVVFFHVKFPIYHADGVIQAMFRFAMPLFFMVSGFFCDTSDRGVFARKLSGKCKHIGKICLIGCVYYFVFQMMIAVFGDSHGSMSDVMERLKNMFSVKSLFEWVIFNQDPFIAILWFVFALLYCYLILGVINRFDCYKTAFCFIPALVAVHMICGNVMSAFGITIEKIYYRNFLLFGLPFVLLGVVIRRNQDVLRAKVSEKQGKVLLGLGIVLCIAEWFLFQRQEMYFGSILFVLGVFIISLHKPEFGMESFITTIGGKYSLFIYIVHSSLISVLDRFVEGSVLRNSGLYMAYRCVKPFLIFVLSVIGAMVFYCVLAAFKKGREEKVSCRKKESR